MGLLSAILRNGSDKRLTWWCPGCNSPHSIQHGAGSGPRWGWNGNADKPTFTPSVLTWWDEPANLDDPEALKSDCAEALARREAGATGDACKVPLVSKRCHSFVVDGAMQFLGDCTHAQAGQTVPIPPWPRPDWSDG